MIPLYAIGKLEAQAVDDAAAMLKNDFATVVAISSFNAVAWYIAIELNTQLFFTFKRYQGLYFWSVWISSWGVILEPLAIMLANFGFWNWGHVTTVLIFVGWAMMVIPQSFVLYSRLRLVMQNERYLRWVLWTICIVSVCMGFPTFILGILGTATPVTAALPVYRIFEKIEASVFLAQEAAISGLYIWYTRERLVDISLLRRCSQEQNKVQVFKHLILSHILIILLDISLLSMSYADLFYIYGPYKSCVYGVKLMIEFGILNRLRSMVSPMPSPSYSYGSTIRQPENSKSGMRFGSSRKAEMVHLDTFDGNSQKGDAVIITSDVEAQRHRASVAMMSPRDGIRQTTEIVMEHSDKEELREKD